MESCNVAKQLKLWKRHLYTLYGRGVGLEKVYLVWENE
jgi:hypothetical protein